jgi:hypothetical protein
MRQFGKDDFLLTSEERRDKQKPCGGVAQSVEQGTENPRVGGSIPSPATSHFGENEPTGPAAFRQGQLPGDFPVTLPPTTKLPAANGRKSKLSSANPVLI